MILYMPIYSTSLNFIIGSAELILPEKYAAILDNRIGDIQNIYPQHILLSKNRWIKECEIVVTPSEKSIRECEVAIEIEFSEKDEKRLKKLDDNFYLYDMPIQLSKVKKMWFISNDVMIRAINLIEMSQGFFPKGITEVDENPNPITFQKPKTKVAKLKDISKKVLLHRKYLGGLILAKNQLGKKDIFKFVDEVLAKTDKDLKKIVLSRMMEREDVKKMAKKENIKLEFFADIIKRKKVPVGTLTYFFTMLLAYKPFMGSKFEGFISDIGDSIFNQAILEHYIIIYGIMSNYNQLDFYSIFEDKTRVLNRFKLEKDDFPILDKVFDRVFKEKILRKDRIVEIAKLDLENINIAELSEKYSVSESTIRKDIREVFGITKNMRIAKFIKLAKLKKLLENSKMTTKEVAEKLKVSQGTARKYFKELGAKN